MPRLYLTNDSYPELRGVNRQWARTATWWRAIGRAKSFGHFWLFALVQACVLIGTNVAAAVLGAPAAAQIAIGVATLVIFSYLQVSWGGDMMRRHLRAVSTIARYACPSCGQSLFGHLRGEDASRVRCPECATEVERAVFEPPYPIPRVFRAFPPW